MLINNISRLGIGHLEMCALYLMPLFSNLSKRCVNIIPDAFVHSKGRIALGAEEVLL